MPAETVDTSINIQPNDKLTKLLNEKKSARDFQERKHQDWNENYELYRNKVRTNRLTQRQAVNIPLMKETVKTLLSEVDDAPAISWRENSGDEMKSLIYQELWESNFRSESLELKDIVDKKNVFLYGISSKFLNLKEDGVSVSIPDVFDVVYDPLTRPDDVETARFIVRQNLFRSLREILASNRYTREGKSQLKHWLATDKGIIQAGKNREQWEKAMERLRAMGLQNDKFSTFAGGDTIVALTEHFTELWDQKTNKFVRHVVVYAEDTIELSDDTLKEAIGTDLWPFEFWSEDMETNDIYPDGVADLVRVPNKVVNVYFSQLVENRTLQNFQMHWFDATVQGYQPQTYEPGPGRMLPAPGDPSKTIMPVAINGLDETLNAINFITSIVERGTGATALNKGTPESGEQTLGEVRILVGKAQERAKTMTKSYRNSWYRLAKKWDAMMQANSFPSMKLYKTSSSGKVFEKKVYNSDWKSEAGYEPVVSSSSEQEENDIKGLQKWGAVMAQFPDNMVLRKFSQMRQLKILDLTPAELEEILNEEERLTKEKQNAMQGKDQEAKAAEAKDLTNSITQSLQALGM
jgi:hypothetical protein